jgi:hypothetical protein
MKDYTQSGLPEVNDRTYQSAIDALERSIINPDFGMMESEDEEDVAQRIIRRQEEFLKHILYITEITPLDGAHAADMLTHIKRVVTDALRK